MAETHLERLDETADLQLQQLMFGGWISRGIGAAAELGVADHLADGPKTSGELAEATHTQPRALYRLLRALASVGIFTEIEPELFELTPMAELLRTDARASMRGMARHHCGEVQLRTWAQLEYSVRTGQPAFERVNGMKRWEYNQQHPDANAIFNDAMSGDSARMGKAVSAAYDFSRFGTVVDVGGGQGALLINILNANPGLSGVLFDLPHVVKRAGDATMRPGVHERCEIIGGDMFADVPAGGDAYVLSRIIHDWDDAHSVAILQNCRQAMGPQGQLLLVEGVIPPGDAPAFSKLGDLNMLVSLGGHERTEAEYRTLFEAAGFRLTRVIPTASTRSIIEGEPA